MSLGSWKGATGVPWTFCEYRPLRDLRDFSAAATPLVLESQMCICQRGHRLVSSSDYAHFALNKEACVL